jgi:Cu(I)/Ag(I) efflux system membrane fusion protein
MKRFFLVIVVLAGLVELLIATRMYSAKTFPAQSTGNSTSAKQLWTCGMHPQVIQDHPGPCPICGMPLIPLTGDLPKGELIHTVGATTQPVVIDPNIVQNMGIRTALVTRGPLIKSIRAVGMLEIPDSAEYDVNLRINGWIEKLHANQEGMYIHKGDVLMDVYSPDLEVAEEELIGATASLKALDPHASDAARDEARSFVDSAKRKLRLWDVDEQDIQTIANSTKPPPTVPFRSPTDGELQEKMVAEGSAFQAGMKLMQIEDHSKLWLQAQIYEQEMSLVKVGQIAQATFESQPDKVYSGPVEFIYPHLDHETRTIMVRVAFDNKHHDLRPGMYATVNILTQPLDSTLLAPREAIIDTGTRQIAFVVQSPGHFEPRDVHKGLTGDNDLVQILNGLNEGETVVTSGQFLLDVNSRTNEALLKFRNAYQNH